MFCVLFNGLIKLDLCFRAFRKISHNVYYIDIEKVCMRKLTYTLHMIDCVSMFLSV